MVFHHLSLQHILVDAPVLVDVDHGSVRYRQPGGSDSKKIKGKEMPYENVMPDSLSNKEHYFYHARLKEYGPGNYVDCNQKKSLTTG